jgi:hypothetical protein
MENNNNEFTEEQIIIPDKININIIENETQEKEIFFQNIYEKEEIYYTFIKEEGEEKKLKELIQIETIKKEEIKNLEGLDTFQKILLNFYYSDEKILKYYNNNNKENNIEKKKKIKNIDEGGNSDDIKENQIIISFLSLNLDFLELEPLFLTGNYFFFLLLFIIIIIINLK